MEHAPPPMTPPASPSLRPEWLAAGMVGFGVAIAGAGAVAYLDRTSLDRVNHEVLVAGALASASSYASALAVEVAPQICGKDDDGNKACTSDGKSQIACTDGKYVISPCRGPEGCKEKGKESVCDKSVAQEGEVCEDPTGGQRACSVDKKSVLECKARKFAVAETCPGAKGCQIQGDKIGCAD